ncbi:hypothetical protein [Reyranella sp.]|uniref:hypothetical protein n=1 Tax=Reyranella sp. TaxID=1929291 RepID=UPI003BAA73D8
MMAFPHHRRGRHRGGVTDVYHHVVCRHQVEIEVWPPRAEVNFRDDWTANVATTQVRFEAQVYNSSQGFVWDVRDIGGGPGQGTIDASGLYRAPPKGALASGTTELVIATSREDPLRKAFAWVSLVGLGPRPAKAAEVAIFPRRINLYYRQGANNDMIDDCNKRCQFEAIAFNSGAAVEWLVNGALQAGTGPWFLYQTPANGGTAVVTVRARLQGSPAVFDEAKISQLNYDWPGI